MALKGNLREFSLVQLLNLINLAKKTGALYIATQDQNIRLVFREGKLAYAAPEAENIPLIRIMAKSKLIPNSLAASIGERYKTLTDQEMGIYLINSGCLSQEQIFAGIESYLREIVHWLFTLKDGVFHFEIGEMPPEQVISVRMNLQSIIIEGARQQHELSDLKNEIPSLEMALKFIDRPGIDLHHINLNAEEWRVVSYVSPKNSIRQIAAVAKLNDLQIRRVVMNLLQTGLVEMVRLANAPVSQEIRALPLKDTRIQRSLVNRVIDRIKAI